MRRLVGIFIFILIGYFYAQAENLSNLFDGPFRTAKNTEFDKWPQTVFSDPDLDYVRITKLPGQRSQDCESDMSKCVGWPDGQTKMTRDLGEGIQEREELNLRTGEVETVQYMKVKFNYDRDFIKKNGDIGSLHKEGEGWIDTRVLRKEKMEPIYKEPVAKIKPPVGKKPSTTPEAKCQTKKVTEQNQRSISDLGNFLEKTPKEQLSATTDLLKPLVGQCPLHPPDVKKAEQWKGKNIYDAEALPLLNSKKASLPKLPKLSPDGKSMGQASFDDVVAIDTLARTLYSEMNECFGRGLQFPMAAAKVALNRTQLVDAGKAPSNFNRPPQVSSKPTLSKVLTSPFQFSVWNQIGVANPNDKTVLMSLCPTRDNSRTNWKSSRGTPEDLAAWDLALKIATEAVLFPSRFDAKTKQVSQYYYTSKRESYDDRKRPDPAPVIEGRAVENYRCMYVWNGK